MSPPAYDTTTNQWNASKPPSYDEVSKFPNTGAPYPTGPSSPTSPLPNQGAAYPTMSTGENNSTPLSNQGVNVTPYPVLPPASPPLAISTQNTPITAPYPIVPQSGNQATAPPSEQNRQQDGVRY